MRMLLSGVVLVLVSAGNAAAQEIDLRADAVRAAVAAAIVDAQQFLPCDEVAIGPCLKLERTGLDEFVRWSRVADHGCAFYDISTTLWGKAKNILEERNPLLRPLADSKDAAIWLTTAKVGMQIAKHFIFNETASHGRKGKIWTGILASSTAGMQCGLAANNHRETQGV